MINEIKNETEIKGTVRSEKTEKINGKYIFNEEEQRQNATKMSNLLKEKERLKAEEKAVRSSFKSKLDAKDAEIKTISEDYSNGYDYRFMECYCVKDFDNKIKRWFRCDNNECILTEGMTSKDFQLRIEEIAAAKKKEKEDNQEKIED